MIQYRIISLPETRSSRPFTPNSLEVIERAKLIQNPQNMDTRKPESAASVMFLRGERPDASTIAKLSLDTNEFSISFDPASDRAADAPPQDEGEASGDWLELITNGLTFDLAGLAPGNPCATPAKRHAYGLHRQTAPEGLEAITLRLGPHLAGGGAIPPIVRLLAGLTAQLAKLPGARAIVWHPAGCWSAPEQFSNSVLDWIAGGPFPMFSLAAFTPKPDGGFLSDGLTLFTEQELSADHDLEAAGASWPKTALRLAHWLVENGRLAHPEVVSGPDDRSLRLEPSIDYHVVNVREL